MASVLQVATIKDQGGNANAIEIANSSANVTINNLTSSTGFPAGHVLQVLHFQDTETNGLDASWTNLYEKSITLKSASSDVFITFQVTYQLPAAQGFGYRIYRNNSATVTTSHTAVWTINPDDGSNGTYTTYIGSGQHNNNLTATAKDTLSGFSVGNTLYYGLFFRIYNNAGSAVQIPVQSNAGNGAFVMQLMEVQK